MTVDIAQLVVLLTAVSIMAKYTSDGARYRVAVSFYSGVMMASLAAWACAIALGRVPGTVGGLILSIVLLGVVRYYRGDVARMIDSIKHLRQRVR